MTRIQVGTTVTQRAAPDLRGVVIWITYPITYTVRVDRGRKHPSFEVWGFDVTVAAAQ